MQKIIPNDDNILVELIEGSDRTAGGLYIPDKARDNQRDARLAKVLACGPGRTTEYGVKIDVTVKAGDLVLIPRANGFQVEQAGTIGGTTKLRIMRCVEVLATLEESRIVGIG